MYHDAIQVQIHILYSGTLRGWIIPLIMIITRLYIKQLQLVNCFFFEEVKYLIRCTHNAVATVQVIHEPINGYS